MHPGTHQHQFNGYPVTIAIKKMRNLRLTVKPPTGEIQVSAPLRSTKAQINQFLTINWDWILTQKQKIAEQSDYYQYRMVSGEKIQLWGKEYRLRWADCAQAKISFQLTGPVPTGQRSTPDKPTITMLAPSKSTCQQRFQALLDWYQQLLQSELNELFAKWEATLGVQASRVRIRRMKSKWGSCNPQTGRITINLELVRYPKPALSYVVLHELTHCLEPSHNQRFYRLIAAQMPNWAHLRQCLNQSPLILAQAATS